MLDVHTDGFRKANEISRFKKVLEVRTCRLFRSVWKPCPQPVPPPTVPWKLRRIWGFFHLLGGLCSVRKVLARVAYGCVINLHILLNYCVQLVIDGLSHKDLVWVRTYTGSPVYIRNQGPATIPLLMNNSLSAYRSRHSTHRRPNSRTWEGLLFWLWRRSSSARVVFVDHCMHAQRNSALLSNRQVSCVRRQGPCEMC